MLDGAARGECGPLTDGSSDEHRGSAASATRSQARPGAHAGHHLGPVAASGKDTIIDALRERPHDPPHHYVVTCTTRGAAAGRGRRRELPLPRSRAVPRAARRRRAPRGERGPRQLVRDAARRGRGALVAGQDVILKIDVQGAQLVKERVPEALLVFLVPPSLEDLFGRLAVAGHRDRRRAGAAPAQRGDRAGPPGGLRPRRRQRDGPGASGPPRRSTRSSPRRIGCIRRAGSASSRPGDARAERRIAASGPRASRLVEVAVDAAGAAGAPDVHLPRARRPGRPRARRGGARRVRAAPGARIVLGEARRGSDRASSRSRSSTASAPTGRSCRRCGSRSPAGSPRHYLAPPALVAPGDAAAGDARAARARRRATARATPGSDGLGAGRARPARPARQRPAARPRPRRARGPGRARCGACGPSPARGAIALDWTLLAASAGPRYERWITLHAEGRAAAALAAGGRPRAGGRWAAPGRAARRAGRHDARPRTGRPSRRARRRARGAARVVGDRRARPARPRRRRRSASDRGGRSPARPAGRRGGRPPAADLTPAQATAVDAIVGRDRRRRPDAAPARRRDRRRQDRDLRGGDRVGARRRPARRSSSCRRSRWRCRSSTGCGPTSTPGSRSSTPASATASGPTSGGASGRGEVDIVVGTRLAVLAPLADVGLVVVDEEHDAAYKSDRTPRLQARDAALELAGWPAPRRARVGDAGRRSVGSRPRRASTGGSCCPTRPVGQPPTVEVVDLRAELAAGNRGLLSRPLAAALGTLDTGAGEQAILVINRRGTRVGRPVPRLRPRPGLPRLRAAARLPPGRARPCAATTADGRRRWRRAARTAARRGSGTSAAARSASSARSRDRFPDLRVGRLDRDVVERRGRGRAGHRRVHRRPARRPRRHEPRHQGPRHPGGDARRRRLGRRRPQPARRARRRADLPAAAQAVGRAGRGDRPGPGDHPDLPARPSGDPRPWPTATPAAFYDAELALRERFGSPPFGRLVKLTVGARGPRTRPRREATAMAERLRARAAERRAWASSVVGPAPAYIARRADRWRFNVVLRGDDPVALLGDGAGGAVVGRRRPRVLLL